MAQNNQLLKDNRFAIIAKDPKFKKIPKHERKVKIDKRFASMFTDKKFKVNYKVDKRGRPIHKSSEENLKKFYDLQQDEDSEKESSSESELEVEVEAKVKAKKNNSKNIKEKLKDLAVDYARGESKLFSESSSDEPESDIEELEMDELDHKWGELDNDAERTDDVSSRLAVCNMDWDRIRALDLMVLFRSFLPSNSNIKSVTIYPSEFGLERMKEEDLKGPTELVDSSCDSSDDDTEMEEGKKYHMEKMRKYQLNRLKYYYAVAEFDTVESANKIYTECDGLEYESSATRLDLRFIPDDVTFDQEPKETCNDIPDVTKYHPRHFTTTALQQAKVELTWDETDPKRKEFTESITQAVINGDLNDDQLKQYVALSSDDEVGGVEESEEEETVKEEESDNEDVISKYRKLMKEISSKEVEEDNDTEMVITWGAGEDNTQNETEQEVPLTPFQQMMERRRKKRNEKKEKKMEEKDKDLSNTEINGNTRNKKNFKGKNKVEENSEDELKKAELELLIMEEDDKKHHFDMNKIKEKSDKKKKYKKKRRSKTENEHVDDDFQVDVSDTRFEALYSSHLYNIDPTNPKFHKTKGMESFINEKLKRKASQPVTTENGKKTKNRELQSLIKSVKRK